MLKQVSNFLDNLQFKRPKAVALLSGSSKYPELTGIVYFFPAFEGTILLTQVTGLPLPDNICSSQFFGFHIHMGTSCTGNQEDEFANAMTHYNPENCPHPAHAGDLPPLLGNRGMAWSAFFTNRFTIPEVLNKTIIIHRNPDDFTTQPSGNSGEKIACGVIEPNRRY